MQKVSKGGPKLRLTVTSKITFMENTEGKTILAWLGAYPEKILQNYTKNTRFRTFWKQILVEYIYETYKKNEIVK